MLEFELLLVLVIANGAPIIAARLLGSCCNRAIDGGLKLGDGQPLFGSSKTWRGIVASVLATVPAVVFIGLEAWQGIVVALLAMAGDLLSSFIKRRLRKPPSSMSLGLDQVPETLLPLLVLQWWLGLDGIQLVTVVVLFLVLVVPLSWLLYRLRIRNRPW